MGDFGDFEEVADAPVPGKKPAEGEQAPPTRVKMPGKGEYIGIILQRLGGNRMEVKCSDGKLRNCRVPGRFKRAFWLRPNDIVIVEPWEGDDEKADIIFHYQKNAVGQLRKAGLLDSLNNEF
jgi:translation initiation factor 1A